MCLAPTLSAHHNGETGRCFSLACSTLIILDVAFCRTMSAPLMLQQTRRTPPLGRDSIEDTATFCPTQRARASRSVIASCIGLLTSCCTLQPLCGPHPRPGGFESCGRDRPYCPMPTQRSGNATHVCEAASRGFSAACGRAFAVEFQSRHSRAVLSRVARSATVAEREIRSVQALCRFTALARPLRSFWSS